MKSVFDFFWDLGAWNWFIVAAALGLLEIITPGVHFMWFGMAAVAMGGLILLLPMPIAAQLVIFALMAMGLILIARRYWSSKELTTDAPDLNDRGQQYVGRLVTVVEPIANGRGKVRVGDTVWTAEGPDMPAGSQAKVTGSRGIVLVVGMR